MAHRHSLSCIDKRGNLLCGQHAAPEEEWEGPRGPRYVIGRQDTPTGQLAVVATADAVFHELIDPSKLSWQRDFDAKGVAYKKRMLERAAAAKAQAAAVVSAKRGLHGFTTGMPAVKARRIEEALDKQVIFSRGGQPERRRDFIERSVTGGRQVETRGNRRTFIDQASTHFYDEKDLTKIGMDYAEFLLTKR